MLYLVQPHGHLQWADLPARTTIRLALEHDVDLARLPWQPSEEPDPGVVLELALRHGVACSLGLVVDGGYIEEHAPGTHVRTTHPAAVEARGALGQHNEFMQQRLDEYMEHVFPGWGAARRSGEVDQPAVDTGDRAEQALRAPIKPELSGRWLELGGRLP